MSLSIDGVYSPFADYPGYSSMAPCMRRCNDDMGFNVRSAYLLTIP